MNSKRRLSCKRPMSQKQNMCQKIPTFTLYFKFILRYESQLYRLKRQFEEQNFSDTGPDHPKNFQSMSMIQHHRRHFNCVVKTFQRMGNSSLNGFPELATSWITQASDNVRILTMLLNFLKVIATVSIHETSRLKVVQNNTAFFFGQMYISMQRTLRNSLVMKCNLFLP